MIGNALRLSLLLIFSCILSLMPLVGLAQTPCGTEAYHQKRMQTDEQYARKFLLLEDKLLEETLSPASRYLDGAVYTIPVVVHVMHKGEALGTGSNISDAQIQAGLNSLNAAFRNVGNFAGDPSFTDAGIASADVEIEFCLASRAPNGSATTGINRINTSLSDLFRDELTTPGNTQDDDLKALSFWDSNEYLNIWIVNSICLTSPNVGCGVAGYASLAGSHGQAHDGVVVEKDFWGLSDNNSKIAIHEVGHYLNLLHTFQSGCPNNDCLIDGDRVCDTPPEVYSEPVSCANGETVNSCSTDLDDMSSNNPFTTDVQDMYENYMDYGFQSCQNTFTPGQKRRMRIALTQQRTSLLTSKGCIPPSSTPTVAFVNGFDEVYETPGANIDCREYVDYQVGIQLMSPSAQTNEINISLAPESQASLSTDVELIGLPVSIPPNTTSPVYFTLRVFDDNNVEEDEFLALNLSVLNGDAVVANVLSSYHLNIYDNDLPPADTEFLFFYEDFEGNSHFAIETGGNNQSNSNWFVGTQGGMDGNRCLYYSNSAGSLVYDHQMPGNRSAIFSIDGRGFFDGELQFDYRVIGEPNRDFGTLLYSTDSINYFPLPNAPTAFVAQPINRTVNISLDPQIFDNQKFYLKFQWQNDFNGLGSDPAWVIDNIQIRGKQTQIETELSAMGEVYFGPYEDVYIYSNTTKKLLARLENLNAHDYGCTTIEIDRAGIGAEQFWDTNPERYLAQKTFKISPTNNTQLGHYRITMYYTQQELASWASATNQNLDDLEMVKADINIGVITPLNYSSYDIIKSPAILSPFLSDVAVSAEFSNTGFSGFGTGVPGGTVTFPVEWAAFTGKYISGTGTLLEWATASEKNSLLFALERSIDGQAYEQLSEIAAAGNSTQIRQYSYTDPNPLEGVNFYRLKQIDIDGTYSYSEVVEVLVDLNTSLVQVSPNPFINELNVYSEGVGDQEFFLTNTNGQIIFKKSWYQDRPQTESIRLSNLPRGLYFWGLRNKHTIKGGKLLKE